MLAVDHEEGVARSEAGEQPLQKAVVEIPGPDLLGGGRQQVGEALVDGPSLAREYEHSAQVEVADTGRTVLVEEAQDLLVEPLRHVPLRLWSGRSKDRAERQCA